MHPEVQFRLRFILIALILMTIPCYCAGLAMVRVSRNQVLATLTETIPASQTATALFLVPSDTLIPTVIPPSSSPTAETPTATLTISASPFMTWTPSITPIPTDTIPLPPTDTATLAPSTSPTYTLPPPPTATETPTEIPPSATITDTLSPTETPAATVSLSTPE